MASSATLPSQAVQSNPLEPGLMENTPQSFQSQTLQSCVENRHSIRRFKSWSVPEQIIRDCVALAQHAPSNSNIQNWRLHLCTGAARDRACAALMEAANKGVPHIGPIPQEFSHHRREVGAELYGEHGFNIAREDKDARRELVLRNYDFFGAPVCGIITMNKDLAPMDGMSVGMFVQTFLLALVERGLGSCLQESVTGYADVVRREFRIPEDEMVLCGIAIGWPAEHRVNDLVIPRDEVDMQVKIWRD